MMWGQDGKPDAPQWTSAAVQRRQGASHKPASCTTPPEPAATCQPLRKKPAQPLARVYKQRSFG
ncbi:hypothetical protein ACUX4O_24645, partial [Salmonella enterica]